MFKLNFSWNRDSAFLPNYKVADKKVSCQAGSWFECDWVIISRLVWSWDDTNNPGKLRRWVQQIACILSCSIFISLSQIVYLYRNVILLWMMSFISLKQNTLKRNWMSIDFWMYKGPSVLNFLQPNISPIPVVRALPAYCTLLNAPLKAT